MKVQRHIPARRGILRALHHGSTAVMGSAHCVVTIPVRNEAERLVSCLDALDALHDKDKLLCRVLLVLNGCSDNSWEVALAWSAHRKLPVSVVEVELDVLSSHAGSARAMALELALDVLGNGPGGIVLTTDADSRVHPGWLRRAVGSLDAGCDAVAGEIDVPRIASSDWPMPLQQRHRAENKYSRLLDEIDAICDPVPHNPWPKHRRCSGANLAFRASALQRIHPFPAPSCGEDRALIDACLFHGLRVRFDALLRVETSGRLHGRATGGMADTLREQAMSAALLCNTSLEACKPHVVRACLSAQARRVFVSGMTDATLAALLGLSHGQSEAYGCAHFGEAWQRLERSAPALVRVALHPDRLAEETGEARSWLSTWTGRATAGVVA